MDEERKKYVNRSTARTLQVLLEFSNCDRSLGITEISERLSMSKTLVHRSIGVLVDEGLLMRNAKTRRYELGPGTLWLSSDRVQQLDIKTVCHPFMIDIERLTGLTVSLQIPVGHHQIPVHGVDGRRSGLTRIVKGVPVPLHISTGSRAILAYMGKDLIDKYIQDNSPLKQITRHTLTDPNDLRRDLAKIREDGFAMGIEDHFLAVRGVAFPIFNEAKTIIGSITLVGSTSSVTDEEIVAFIPKVQEIMEDLNNYMRLQATLPTAIT